jgi:glyoxalase family protein
VTQTAFAVPENALDFWISRLAQRAIDFQGPFERFGEQGIALSDPDGMRVELIATKSARDERAYQAGPIPLEFAIRGFHSATLSESDHLKTAGLLTSTMGFKLLAQDGDRFRYAVESGEPSALVDVLRAPKERPGRVLVGTVHHIAWRTPDDQQQLRWLTELTRLNYGVSPVMDREYFHSIYYREPGGILFEIATDPPGFAINETPDELGSKLVLPPWLEPERAKLEAILPPLRLQAPAIAR